jgi:ABC-2 type transport system ATP-binding protein
VLSDVDLTVAPGELVALLGPNGAGKTTLLRVACGRIAADAGVVRIGDRDPRRQPQARRLLGLVPQDIALYPYLSVIENLQVIGRMMDVPFAGLGPRIREALAWSGLEERRGDRVESLSGGMRRRLNIVASLLHQPALLLLDEPTVGVDVIARERIHELLRQLRARGLGLLLTTHDLQQAASLADRVVFLVDGRVRLEGRPGELIRTVYGHDKELVVTFATAPACQQVDVLKARGLCPARDGLTWMGSVQVGYRDAVGWSEALQSVGLEVTEIRVREPGLEGVFLRVTGEELPA